MANEILSQPIGVVEADPRVAVTRADMSGPNVVEAIGSLGGEVVKGVQEGRAIKGVGDDVERFTVLSEANSRGMVVDPNTGKVTGDVRDAAMEAKLMEARASSEQKFKEIALANEQHGVYHGSMAARLHTERTIRDLSLQTPGFEDEIRRTAASILGYDPMGFGMRQILDVDDPRKAGSGPLSELDKWRQQVELAVHQYNVSNPNNKTTYDKMNAFMSKTEVNMRSTASTQSRIDNGTASITEILSQVEMQPNPLVGLYQKAQEMTAAGDGRDWKDAQVLSNELTHTKQVYKQKLLADLQRANPNAIVGQEAIDQVNKRVDDYYAPYEQIINDTTVTAFLTKQGAQFELMSIEKVRELAPLLTMLSEGSKSPALAENFMEVFFNTLSDGQNALWIQQNPAMKSMVGDIENPLEFLTRGAEEMYGFVPETPKGSMSKNKPELTPEEREKQDAFNSELLKMNWNDSNISEKNEIVKVLAENDPKRTLAIISADPNSFRQMDLESRKVIAATQVTEIRAVIEDLSEITISGDMEFRLDPNTGEILPFHRYESKDKPGTYHIRPASYMRTPAAVKRYNKVHLPLMKNDQWRGYITSNSMKTPAIATGHVLGNVDMLQRREELNKAERRLADSVRQYGRFIERGVDPDPDVSERMTKAKADRDRLQDEWATSVANNKRNSTAWNITPIGGDQ